jgi:AcrR family transcriptional regulator
MVGAMDGRRSRHAHRRGELVGAATDYIAANGFAGLSMRPLAAGIGVSHATLLHHFGTKDALVSEVLHELRERDRLLIAATADRLGDEASIGDVIRLAWQHMSAPSQREYWRLVFGAYGVAVADPDRYERFLDGAVTDWIALSEAQLAAAGVAKDRRDGLATLIVGAFRGVLLDLLVTGARARGGRAIDQLANAVQRQVVSVHDRRDAGRRRQNARQDAARR